MSSFSAKSISTCILEKNRPKSSPYSLTFSLIPPTGKTMPRNEISPVIAKFSLTGRPVANDKAAVTIVQPALGPS